MANNTDDKELSLAALALTREKEDVIVRVAQQLRSVLAHELKTNHIEAVEALGATARISALLIHQIQGLFNEHSGGLTVVDVEQEYQDMLTAYLTSYDMESEATEMDNMNNEAVN
jgi:hydrogenase maturation factor HypF (carbamoyltransferase family)